LTTICRWLLAAAAALVVLAGCDSGPKFQSTDITGAPYGKALELADAQGDLRHLEDFRGKAVVLFFGFTRCPDVCPTTLAEIAGAVKTLGPDAERVQVLFVTVDPERDTPQALREYVGAFDPRFIALRGDEAATQRVAKEFKIYYEKRKQGETYTIDHSAQAYVLDPQGRLRLLVRHDRIGKDLAPDLRTLLRETA
jgi:protein SCO1/2